MMSGSHFIDGRWRPGNGPAFGSINPATGGKIWDGRAAAVQDVNAAVDAARAAFGQWSRLSVNQRISHLKAFAALLAEGKNDLARAIAMETGKPLWDAAGEAGAMVNKLDISITAYQERTGEKVAANGAMRTRLTHKPHGVLAVFGPYNFPGHLPNGHIIPALLAGNTVIFKPSELTPMVAEKTVELWEKSGLPAGVLNLVQGAKGTGIALSSHSGIDGLLFTGSAATGHVLAKQFAGTPHKILALELGGNNPLIVWDVEDIPSAAMITMQSAYITSGQRCTCARRLIVQEGPGGDRMIERLAAAIDGVRIGAFDDETEPFMGPVISKEAAGGLLAAQDQLKKKGGKVIREMAGMDRGPAYLTPGLMDVTNIADLPDEEHFGPFLKVSRMKDFTAAIEAANRTKYGLAAGLLSDSEDLFNQFYRDIRAGIVNWNQPLPGASSSAPFGGIGASGNHWPGAYYAADYCAYPVAGLEAGSNRVDSFPTPKGVSL